MEGLFGIIIFALVIYGIYCVVHEENWSGTKKVVWIVLMLLFSVISLILYFLIFRETGGRKKA